MARWYRSVPAGTVCVTSVEPPRICAPTSPDAFPAGSGVAATPPRLRRRRGAALRRSRQVRSSSCASAHLPARRLQPFTAVVGLTEATTTAAEVRVFTCGTPLPAPPLRSFEPNVAQSAPQFVRTDANGDVCVRSTGTVAIRALAARRVRAQFWCAPRYAAATARHTGVRRRPWQPTPPGAVTVPVGTGAWFGLTLVGPAIVRFGNGSSPVRAAAPPARG